MSRRASGGAAVLALMVLLAVAPAFACGGNRGNITVTPNVVDAGKPVDVVGSQFQAAPAPIVSIKWGSVVAPMVAVAPDENGSFRVRIDVPAGAQTGFHQVTATQPAPEGEFVAHFAVEVRGVQTPITQPALAATAAPTAAPSPATEPAASALPAPAPAAAPKTDQAVASRRTSTAVTGSPAPAAASAAPVAAPAPAVAPPSPVEPAPSESVGTPAAEATPIPALPRADPAGLGRPSAEKIGSGTAPWLVGLVGVGLVLAVASCAAVGADVRRKRATADTAPAAAPDKER